MTRLVWLVLRRAGMKATGITGRVLYLIDFISLVGGAHRIACLMRKFIYEPVDVPGDERKGCATYAGP